MVCLNVKLILALKLLCSVGPYDVVLSLELSETCNINLIFFNPNSTVESGQN
jgi:hypothetical protein